MNKLMLAVVISALAGCGPINRQANFSPATFTPSANAKNLTLETASAVCRTAIPFASDPVDDGDRTFSAFKSTNVSMSTPSGRIVCAVNAMTGAVDRIHDGKREVALLEFQQRPSVSAAREEYSNATEIELGKDDLRFSYKGVRIGDPLPKLRRSLPLYACTADSCSFMIESCASPYGSSTGRMTSTREGCRSGSSFGGADVTYGYISIIDNAVASIELTIPTNSMRQLSAVLIEKFGSPAHSDKSTIQNRMGATFDNWENVWVMDSDKLSAKLRSSNVDEGLVRISGQAAEKRQIDSFRKRVDRGSKDF